MFRVKYPERVIAGVVRRGVEVSEFFHHLRLKAKVGLHFKIVIFMYVKGVKSNLFADFQINFFGCDCVAPGFLPVHIPCNCYKRLTFMVYCSVLKGSGISVILYSTHTYNNFLAPPFLLGFPHLHFILIEIGLNFQFCKLGSDDGM